ncbi:MAG: co-chaperone GroES [Planctomycetes bacterium]|nr:co-chaperone GroES [Planctomycetota bacterium]
MGKAKQEKKAGIRPLGDRVLVEPHEADEVSAGGIVLPDSAKEKPQKGTIVAVGEGRLLDNGERVAPNVAVGDTVYFGKYSGTEVKVAGTEFKIMREGEILAKESK